MNTKLKASERVEELTSLIDGKIDELIEKSASNNDALLQNKAQINERRQSILENRKGIEANRAKLA